MPLPRRRKQTDLTSPERTAPPDVAHRNEAFSRGPHGSIFARKSFRSNSSRPRGEDSTSHSLRDGSSLYCLSPSGLKPGVNEKLLLFIQGFLTLPRQRGIRIAIVFQPSRQLHQVVSRQPRNSQQDLSHTASQFALRSKSSRRRGEVPEAPTVPRFPRLEGSRPSKVPKSHHF